MKPILELATPTGSILIQAQEEDMAIVVGTSKLDDVIVKIGDSLESKLDALSEMAEGITRSLMEKVKSAESFEVEFGISFTVKGTIYVVQSEAQGTFKVKLICKPVKPA